MHHINHYYLYFLLLVSGLCLTLKANEDFSRDAFDDLIALVDNQDVTNFITSSSTDTTRQASKSSIIVLLNNLEIIPLLQENVFLRTNNLKSRSLLDYPEFFPFSHTCDERVIYIDLFYNQTTRLNFTKDNTNICSYLGIFQPSFANKLQNVIASIQAVRPNLTIDDLKISRLLELARTFTVQERRLGLMIGGQATYGCWHINIMAPWYYLERNHFVDKKIEDAIESLIAEIQEEIIGVQSLTPEQITLDERRKSAFIDQHFISDKFGIGDTRIYADRPFFKRKQLTTRIGFLATIPTAFAMKKGLKGTSFSRQINRPLLNLQEIVELAVPPFNQASPDVFNFGLAFLDNLGAMILDTPLGNGGHFGIGILARNKSPLQALIKQDWARNFTMRSFVSLEYQFPAVEWRSFRVPVNEALFNARNLESTDPLIVDVNSNYAFIVQQITDRLFPMALQARVNPGIIFRWSSQFRYEGESVGFTLGTDTYVRNREKFSHVYTNENAKRMIDIFNARSSLAYQSKAVGSIFFNRPKCDRTYCISLYGDYTFMNRGIGADYMLSLHFDVVF